MKATNEKRALVCINVYGLSKVNMLIDNAGLGVYHTGVQVYDHEWAFGGHPYSISGIFTMVKPRDLKSLTNIDGLYDFKQCIRIGHTTLSYRNILLLLDKLGNNYLGNTYHMLYNNCNNFSDDLCQRLCKRGIPKWINRTAVILSLFPSIIELIPRDYLMPQALQNSVNEQLTGVAEEASGRNEIESAKRSNLESIKWNDQPTCEELSVTPRISSVITCASSANESSEDLLKLNESEISQIEKRIVNELDASRRKQSKSNSRNTKRNLHKQKEPGNKASVDFANDHLNEVYQLSKSLFKQRKKLPSNRTWTGKNQ